MYLFHPEDVLYCHSYRPDCTWMSVTLTCLRSLAIHEMSSPNLMTQSQSSSLKPTSVKKVVLQALAKRGRLVYSGMVADCLENNI